MIIDALEKLAEKHPTYGFKKMFYLLRAEGHLWNHKRIYRLYVMMVKSPQKAQEKTFCTN